MGTARIHISPDQEYLTFYGKQSSFKSDEICELQIFLPPAIKCKHSFKVLYVISEGSRCANFVCLCVFVLVMVFRSEDQKEVLKNKFAGLL